LVLKLRVTLPKLVNVFLQSGLKQYIISVFPNGFFSCKSDTAVELVLEEECSYVMRNASLPNVDVNTLIALCQGSRSKL